MGAEDEGEQGSGRGKEQITTPSRAAEKTWEARKGLHWLFSISPWKFKKYTTGRSVFESNDLF